MAEIWSKWPKETREKGEASDEGDDAESKVTHTRIYVHTHTQTHTHIHILEADRSIVKGKKTDSETFPTASASRHILTHILTHTHTHTHLHSHTYTHTRISSPGATPSSPLDTSRRRMRCCTLATQTPTPSTTAAAPTSA